MTFIAASSSSANDITPGVLGFLVVAGIGVVLVFLLRSMNKQFRKLPPPEDGPAAGPGTAGSADSADAADRAHAADGPDVGAADGPDASASTGSQAKHNLPRGSRAGGTPNAAAFRRLAVGGGC